MSSLLPVCARNAVSEDDDVRVRFAAASSVGGVSYLKVARADGGCEARHKPPDEPELPELLDDELLLEVDAPFSRFCCLRSSMSPM